MKFNKANNKEPTLVTRGFFLVFNMRQKVLSAIGQRVFGLWSKTQAKRLDKNWELCMKSLWHPEYKKP